MSASGVDVVVRGGRVVTSSDVVEAAVAIRGDKIAAIGPESLFPPAERVIDASGKLVLPGLIDCHLHIGPEYDDWRTAPAAAARTGLTTLMPFVVYDEGETLPKAVARLREQAAQGWHNPQLVERFIAILEASGTAPPPPVSLTPDHALDVPAAAGVPTC